VLVEQRLSADQKLRAKVEDAVNRADLGDDAGSSNLHMSGVGMA
jgi:hypothetical protein